MIERYINKLLKQYQSAIKNENFSLDCNNNKLEFYNYLLELRNKIEVYKSLLKYSSDTEDLVSIEPNKGVYDTITTSADDIKTILITPYAKTFDNVGNRIIYKGTVTPMEVDLNGVTIKCCKSGKLTIPFYDYVQTSNPFDIKEISNLKYLSLYNKVCLGIYGSVYDKDYDKKLKKLGEFNDYVNGRMDVIRLEDTYAGVSVSRNPKIYKKTR